MALALALALPTPALAAPPSESTSLPSDAPTTAPPSERRRSRHSISLGYYGVNFIKPGFALGYDFRAIAGARDRHALVVGAELGTYHWARHHTGLLVTPHIGWRGEGRRGLRGEALLHVGYLHGFAAGDVFEVVDGQVRETSASFPYLWFGGTLGVGWVVRDVGDRVDLTPFARVGAFGQYPVFDHMLARFVMTIGIEVRL